MCIFTFKSQRQNRLWRSLTSHSRFFFQSSDAFYAKSKPFFSFSSVQGPLFPVGGWGYPEEIGETEIEDEAVWTKEGRILEGKVQKICWISRVVTTSCFVLCTFLCTVHSTELVERNCFQGLYSPMNFKLFQFPIQILHFSLLIFFFARSYFNSKISAG